MSNRESKTVFTTVRTCFNCNRSGHLGRDCHDIQPRPTSGIGRGRAPTPRLHTTFQGRGPPTPFANQGRSFQQTAGTYGMLGAAQNHRMRGDTRLSESNVIGAMRKGTMHVIVQERI